MDFSYFRSDQLYKRPVQIEKVHAIVLKYDRIFSHCYYIISYSYYFSMQTKFRGILTDILEMTNEISDELKNIKKLKY